MNLNDTVEVTFTALGVERFHEYHKPLTTPPGLPENHIWRGQLWELINILGCGEGLWMGSRPLIEKNEVRVMGSAGTEA
jgi:hypothetical protein